jgi:hypothetical protein
VNKDISTLTTDSYYNCNRYLLSDEYLYRDVSGLTRS